MNPQQYLIKYPREKMIKKYNLKVGDTLQFGECRSNAMGTIIKLGEKTISWKPTKHVVSTMAFTRYRSADDEIFKNLGQVKQKEEVESE